MSPAGRSKSSEPRARTKVRWGVVLALLALTWAGMCYGIYAVVSAGKL